MNRPLLTCALFLFITAIGSSGCQSTRKSAGVSLLSSSGFVKDWEAPLGLANDPIKAVYLRGGVVVVYAQSNRGYFLDASSGSILGFDRVTSPGHALMPPVETTSFLAIPTASSIELFDKVGHRVNSFEPGIAFLSPGTSQGNSLFIGISHQSDARLGRFDLTAEQIKTVWELYTTDRLQSAPAALNDSVFAGGADGKVWAVTSSRVPLWNTPGNVFRTDGAITADLSVDDSGLYVPSQDKKLYVLDRTTGRLKWTYYAGLPLLEPAVIIGNNVYQQVPDRGLAALDKNEGNFARTPLWVQPQAQQVLSADERYLYVRSGNSIVALDRATGEPAFHSTRTDLVSFATNTLTPTIYAATRDGSILAIRPVLKPGTVGEVVLNTTVLHEQIASAN